MKYGRKLNEEEMYNVVGGQNAKGAGDNTKIVENSNSKGHMDTGLHTAKNGNNENSVSNGIDKKYLDYLDKCLDDWQDTSTVIDYTNYGLDRLSNH